MEILVGKEIQLYPGDTKSKFGKIIVWSKEGILLTITKSNSSDYEVGKDYYISHSKSLIFKVL